MHKIGEVGKWAKSNWKWSEMQGNPRASRRPTGELSYKGEAEGVRKGRKAEVERDLSVPPPI